MLGGAEGHPDDLILGIHVLFRSHRKYRKYVDYTLLPCPKLILAGETLQLWTVRIVQTHKSRITPAKRALCSVVAQQSKGLTVNNSRPKNKKKKTKNKKNSWGIPHGVHALYTYINKMMDVWKRKLLFGGSGCNYKLYMAFCFFLFFLTRLFCFIKKSFFCFFLLSWSCSSTVLFRLFVRM